MYLNVVRGVIQKPKNDGQHLLAVVQNLRLTVLRELPQAEARALTNVRAGIKRQLGKKKTEKGGRGPVVLLETPHLEHIPWLQIKKKY